MRGFARARGLPPPPLLPARARAHPPPRPLACVSLSPARSYFGYQPKPNADELRAIVEFEQAREGAAGEIHGTSAATRRGGARAARQEWVIKHTLRKAQARMRGWLQRRKFAAEREEMRLEWLTTVIQPAGAGCRAGGGSKSSRAAGALKVKDAAARHMQRAFRGLSDRLRIKKLPRRARRELNEADRAVEVRRRRRRARRPPPAGRRARRRRLARSFSRRPRARARCPHAPPGTPRWCSGGAAARAASRSS